MTNCISYTYWENEIWLRQFIPIDWDFLGWRYYNLIGIFESMTPDSPVPLDYKKATHVLLELIDPHTKLRTIISFGPGGFEVNQHPIKRTGVNAAGKDLVFTAYGRH